MSGYDMTADLAASPDPWIHDMPTTPMAPDSPVAPAPEASHGFAGRPAPSKEVSDVFAHWVDEHVPYVKPVVEATEHSFVGPMVGSAIDLLPGATEALDAETLAWGNDDADGHEKKRSEKKCVDRAARMAAVECDAGTLPNGADVPPGMSLYECQQIWANGRPGRTAGTNTSYQQADGSVDTSTGQIGVTAKLGPPGASVDIGGQSGTQHAESTTAISGSGTTMSTTRDPIRGYKQKCADAAEQKYQLIRP